MDLFKDHTLDSIGSKKICDLTHGKVYSNLTEIPDT
jgi:hypothetical protein